MFYKMITNARDRWYASSDCAINSVIDYIIEKNEMRDAQVEAIKTYLFLKIACDNKPLATLFSEGKFNSLDLDELSIPTSLRKFLRENPAAAALYEYATLKDDAGEKVSIKIEKQILNDANSIDYDKVFQDLFYGVSYTDYLYSLPMGAGKTFLMAAFIYLDLYFASNEPQNKSFAHNFFILVPSGLKTSIVPSLRTIQKFDPSWVIPEPAASYIKKKLIFEVLDENKSKDKSNQTKNPNVQKIANYKPFDDLFGLVVVTNAEKVILNGVEEKNGQITFYEGNEDEEERMANELRYILGEIPSVSVFIDEVQHAATNEIKLRAVVNRWVEKQNVNSVVGFSGTPYIEEADKVNITDKLSIRNKQISNVVYYYPLIQGIGNFLKTPVVKISSSPDPSRIVEEGVREFLDNYLNTVYTGNLTAKLAIYCGSIARLEEVIYPLVRNIAAEYGLEDNSILRFYRKNEQYVPPADCQMLYDTLDSNISHIRIILLVQIGKEGWDCRSLTGVILPQTGGRHKNMVLQTSCRCLRQVERNNHEEKALIYLNEHNANILNSELEKQQHIDLKEFQSPNTTQNVLNRYDRTKYLKLPKIDFYQMVINYETQITEIANPRKDLPGVYENAEIEAEILTTTDFTMERISTEVNNDEHGSVIANYNIWLYKIVKESFNTLSMEKLIKNDEVLRKIFEIITYEKDNMRFFSSHYNIELVNSNIRKAFCDKRHFVTDEEEIPEQASLLNICNFSDKIYTDHKEEYFPNEQQVENIIKDDQGLLSLDSKTQQLISLAEEAGEIEMAEELKRRHSSYPNKDRSFHYLPYHSDSNFEQEFLNEMLTFKEISDRDLEIYYNGDKSMTEFRIKCYQKLADGKWEYLGWYTPDFLIIKRVDGAIYKVIIVETKGQAYADDPKFIKRRNFMDTIFVPKNNEKFGYERFDYLYLEDTLSVEQRLALTQRKIVSFFGED